MRVTAKMIADELGLSIATVDRVLNNRKGVSEKTINKVKSKAQELGYQPNRAAKFLATQKVINIAFILPVFPNYFWDDLDHEIKEGATLYSDFGLRVDVHRVHTVPENQQVEYLQEIVDSKKYEGIVIAAHDTKPLEKIIDQATKENIAVFTINTDVPNSQRIAYVGSDYYDAGFLAGELICLFSSSAQNIIFIREKENTFQMQNKENGFTDYFKKKDLNIQLQKIKYDTSAYIEAEKVEKLLKDHKEMLMNADAIYVAGGLLDKIIPNIEEWENKPVIIGHDINETIYRAFQKDLITASICQDPIAQANFSLKKIMNYFLDDNISHISSYIVKPEIVTKANTKYYINNENNLINKQEND
ncbi:substrate-binding domain-containing protein [Gracilibacillus salitolerans]|uniref:Substrate-binding domain-containing protein n=1 Tax=Gracilibacillus salitolerans TaxID=2663022 RepID=A0A5Q2TIV2_9BACI|nr:LacI family DNA-binding transcriptional regulator [Gracilibacillus salitolerans]QGH33972.1 substrate-binding domain-containing protein [Gracilibacillus salitolerans]